MNLRQGVLRMNAYTELKKEFDHLQLRTLQLFKDGQKRAHKLEGAIVNAWNQFGKIAEMDNINDIKRRSSAMKSVLEELLSENARELCIGDEGPPNCWQEDENSGHYAECDYCECRTTCF